jgi:hypothetical protein
MAKLNWNRQYLRQQRIKRKEETAVYTNGKQPLRATKKQRALLRALGYAQADDPFLLLTQASEIIAACLLVKKNAQA